MSSYNIDGSFNKEGHNKEMQESLLDATAELSDAINRAMHRISSIFTMTMDDEIQYRCRIILNELLDHFKAGTKFSKVMQMINAKRWDIMLHNKQE